MKKKYLFLPLVLVFCVFSAITFMACKSSYYTKTFVDYFIIPIDENNNDIEDEKNEETEEDENEDEINQEI